MYNNGKPQQSSIYAVHDNRLYLGSKLHPSGKYYLGPETSGQLYKGSQLHDSDEYYAGAETNYKLYKGAYPNPAGVQYSYEDVLYTGPDVDSNNIITHNNKLYLQGNIVKGFREHAGILYRHSNQDTGITIHNNKVYENGVLQTASDKLHRHMYYDNGVQETGQDQMHIHPASGVVEYYDDGVLEVGYALHDGVNHGECASGSAGCKLFYDGRLSLHQSVVYSSNLYQYGNLASGASLHDGVVYHDGVAVSSGDYTLYQDVLYKGHQVQPQNDFYVVSGKLYSGGALNDASNYYHNGVYYDNGIQEKSYATHDYNNDGILELYKNGVISAEENIYFDGKWWDNGALEVGDNVLHRGKYYDDGELESGYNAHVHNKKLKLYIDGVHFTANTTHNGVTYINGLATGVDVLIDNQYFDSGVLESGYALHDGTTSGTCSEYNNDCDLYYNGSKHAGGKFSYNNALYENGELLVSNEYILFENRYYLNGLLDTSITNSMHYLRTNIQILSADITATAVAGKVILWAGELEDKPDGYIEANGSLLSSTEYPALYAAIGTAWGNENGVSGEFNIPDMRGYVLRGVDNGAGVDPDSSTRTALKSGGNIGDNVGSLQQDELKSHTHAYNDPRQGGNRGLDHDGAGLAVENPYRGLGTTEATGGNETRMKNVGVHYLISCGTDSTGLCSRSSSDATSNHTTILAELLDFKASIDKLEGSRPWGVQAAGVIRIWTGEYADKPDGYAYANGSSLSSDDYPALYAAIGTAWGNENGVSGEFNIPDMRGYVLRGVDNGAGVDPDSSTRTALKSGGNIGDNVGSLQQDELKSHTHVYTDPRQGGNRGLDRDGAGLAVENPYRGLGTTASHGGNETRMKNVGVHYLISCGTDTGSACQASIDINAEISALTTKIQSLLADNDSVTAVDNSTGIVMPWSGEVDDRPSGYLHANGAAFSSDDYPLLYAAIGTAWGDGTDGCAIDTVCDFNIPDMRGYVLRGVDNGAGVDPDSSTRTALKSGGNIGDNVGSLQQDELKSHTHVYTDPRQGGNRGLEHDGAGLAVENPYQGLGTTAATGGNETRMKNVGVHYLISCGTECVN